MKVVGTVAYVDDLLINYAIESMRDQTYPLDEIVLIEQFPGIKHAFSAALDYGYNCEYDVLVWTAADIIWKPNLVEKYLKTLKKGIFMARCHADDVMLRKAPGGAVGIDMKILQKYRPGRDGFGVGVSWDHDFFVKVGNATGTKYKRADSKGETLTIHHPIWTPFEMYGKVRASLPRFFGREPKTIDRYKKFFKKGLKRDPGDLTLRVGYDLFKKMVQNLPDWVMLDKRLDIIRKEWEEFKKAYPLTGEEFFAMPGWEKTAKKLIKEKMSKGVVEISSSVKRVRKEDLYD